MTETSHTVSTVPAAPTIELPIETPNPQRDRPQNRHWTFLQRHGMLAVGLSPIVANVIGSIFNIAYNTTQIQPLLSPAQMAMFESCWQWFNVLVYPTAALCFAAPLLWLRPIHRALLLGESVEEEKLQRAQRYVVNLPWWFLLVAGIGWLICIPVFPAVIGLAPEPLSSEAYWHLVTSFLIASLIAVTHSFFAVELMIQKALFPIFFRRQNPASVPGGVPLNIPARGVLWAFSAVVCPVVSLVLLLLNPDAAHTMPYFGVMVGGVAIMFGLVTSLMMGSLIATPVRKLHKAATRVADGDFNVRVNLLRSDDFGLLIERFNKMVEGLREREVLQETFGRHVGRRAAIQILKQDANLVGRSQEISVMFVDVRNFTAKSSTLPPEQVVSALNIFFEKAVERVEDNGGMVNKFLGDGFMAIFGIGTDSQNHADDAVRAGLDLIRCVADSYDDFVAAGWPDLQIGVGVNSGPAVVGSIGSPRRQEYTAIGDTVNVAARIESLTKNVRRDFLISAATYDRLTATYNLEEMPPQPIKGKQYPVSIKAVHDLAASSPAADKHAS